MDVDTALTAVRTSPSILEALRAGELLEGVGRGATPDEVDVLVAGTADDDPITAMSAVHALGAQGGAQAALHLVGLLDDDRAHVAEHAVEALGSVPPHRSGVARLARCCADGGFTGMLAQRTLETWADAAPDAVHGALAAALTSETDPSARARLVETVGLVPGPATIRLLIRVAGDDTEADVVRAAALAALGDVLADPQHRDAAGAATARAALAAVRGTTGPLARVAALALSDELATEPVPGGHAGLTVVQLFLHGDLDGSLRHSGQGDTGGVATLLVHLGDALMRQGARVERVITVSGSRHEATATGAGEGGSTAGRPLSAALSTRGHHYARIPLWGPSTGAATAWPLRVQARRGIRRVLRAAGRVDAIHLRMADVGSMVAAEVAAELGIPVVLTVAPDPQALIAAREADGSLTRSVFGEADRAEHLCFRDRLVRRLAGQAEHLVLFPRPDVERSISRLVGIDVAAQPERVDVVGEGIDLAALERVAKEVGGGAPRSRATTAALDDLDTMLAQLPTDRRSLPLALSVGRLAPVKGMATLVSTWLTDPTLRARCNLVVIGGDLDDPTPEEAGELSRIRDALSTDDSAGAGLLLAGHRPNATTTAWLAASQRSRPGLSAPGGVYVCASLKEEFGIAILEAMAMGLVVVAPNGGGPATYIEDGVTGVLADTSLPRALAEGVSRALDLAASPGDPLRSRRSRAVVRERFGIDTMAASLCEVYSRVAAGHVAQSRPLAATP
ncbi:MAG TPA: glycosyltransferase [Ornithinibacter sp.]|nr:glycosyltransferase [Ornithinibacter sp.]